MTLTHNQKFAIDLTEKTGSVVSLIGALFIIVTFISSSKFRKPINRLVFYASWGNVFTNVATLIGTSAISRGNDAPLCIFQGFMIQWFMLTDAFWAFCMACNVYLSFFRHYDAAKLRQLEWKYALACYGIPAVPAIVYCFIKTEERGSIYGDAVLWCWVSIHWDFLRIAVFYGPAWIVILLTWGIYLRVGLLILQWRRQLRSISKNSDLELRGRRSHDVPTYGIRRTEEVSITTEVMAEPARTYTLANFQPPRPVSWVHVSSCARGWPDQYHHEILHDRASQTRMPSSKTNKAAFKYFKCAMLFFVALLCTWVPSTVNRIYTLVFPDVTPFGPAYAAGLVLPLQGFWNFLVYVTTSRWAIKSFFAELKEPRTTSPSRSTQSRTSLMGICRLNSQFSTATTDDEDEKHILRN